MVSMEGWRIKFKAARGGYLAGSSQGLMISFAGDLLEVSIRFDFRTQPLILRTHCAANDLAEVTYLGYRLELRINDELRDEEWPAGKCSITNRTLARFSAEFPPFDEHPVTLRDGFQADHWMPGNGVYVGDCMPFVDGDTFHIFYLKDRRRHSSKWKLGAHQWAHICSDDMISWRECPMAIEIDHPSEGSICTGSVVKYGGKYRAYYAVRMSDGTPAKITYAESDDCVHFTKTNQFFRLSAPYDAVSARDPKAFVDADGELNLLITTSIRYGTEDLGCLARFRSKDGQSWRVVRPIARLNVPDQPECSDYFRFGGKYYLVYSEKGMAHYFVSDEPNGPWTAPENNDVAGRILRVPKAAEWKGNLYFVGWQTDGPFGGKMRVVRAIQAKNGALSFEKSDETSL